MLSPQIRQSAADWAVAGMPPMIMAVYGAILMTQCMNDLGEKDGESGECRFLGTAPSCKSLSWRFSNFHEGWKDGPSRLVAGSAHTHRNATNVHA